MPLPEENNEGYTRWFFWELLNTFGGEHTSLLKEFFYGKILINKEDISEAK